MIKIQCVALRSPNPKKLVDFYEKVFGLKFSLQEYPHHYHKDWYVAREEDGERAILEIHELEDGNIFLPVSFSFKADSAEDLQKIKRGIWDYKFPEDYKVPDTSHDENIMLKDIDGNIISVML
jgi:catechol 2,3-dioxygenase-like lactoylglutathione lyase family enzyme